jgi:hypothetical protein
VASPLHVSLLRIHSCLPELVRLRFGRLGYFVPPDEGDFSKLVRGVNRVSPRWIRYPKQFTAPKYALSAHRRFFCTAVAENLLISSSRAGTCPTGRTAIASRKPASHAGLPAPARQSCATRGLAAPTRDSARVERLSRVGTRGEPWRATWSAPSLGPRVAFRVHRDRVAFAA